MPLGIHAQGAKAASAFALVAAVGLLDGAAGCLHQGPIPPGFALGEHNKRHQCQRLALAQFHLHASIEVQAVALFHVGTRFTLVQHDGIARSIHPARAAVGIVLAVGVHGRHGEGVVGVLRRLVVARPRNHRRGAPVFQAHPGAKLVEFALEGLFQHHIDGACHCPCTVFGRRSAQDFNAFHLIGWDVSQVVAWPHALAIDEQLGVAATHATHAHVAATAPGAAALRDAGKTLEYFGHRTVAIALDFFLADDDFRGRGRAALLGVVGGADHFDWFQGGGFLAVLAFHRGGGWGIGGLFLRCRRSGGCALGQDRGGKCTSDQHGQARAGQGSDRGVGCGGHGGCNSDYAGHWSIPSEPTLPGIVGARTASVVVGHPFALHLYITSLRLGIQTLELRTAGGSGALAGLGRHGYTIHQRL